ncbi:MAG: CPBP family intramembrane metalloprotease [Pseudomonadota bacterium]|nr:CPBP family intramembrane metalloprotease [Pseudomonadota bacterium]
MRAFAWFIASILLAGLLGAALAYPAYELTLSFAAWAFHRVASRIAMLVLLLLLTWLCRHLHIRSKEDFGYGLPWRKFICQSLLWGVIGMVTAAFGAAFLLRTGLRVIDAQFSLSAASLAHILLVGIGSGIGVALLEETLMRGAMHTAIERESGPWTAALLTAPLFALLHFFAKAHIPADEVRWSSGFHLLLLSFAPLGNPSLVFDAFLSWLLIGLILSMTRVLTGNIAVAIGLHAGWVVVLRMLQQSTGPGASPAYAGWIGQFDGLLGYWLLPWGTAIAVIMWLTRFTWVPAARPRAG